MTKLRWNNPPREADPANSLKAYTSVKPVVRNTSGKKFDNLSISLRETKRFEKVLEKLRKRYFNLKNEERMLKKKILQIESGRLKRQIDRIDNDIKHLEEKINAAAKNLHELRMKMASII